MPQRGIWRHPQCTSPDQGPARGFACQGRYGGQGCVQELSRWWPGVLEVLWEPGQRGWGMGRRE